MVYGYARVSTPKQNIEQQIRNIIAFNSKAMIVKEVYTGTKFQERSQLNKLLKIVKNGDVIIFDSVSRMTRNAEEGFELYNKLFESGISLIFLKKRYIDTDVYKQALQNKIGITINSGDKITDKFLSEMIRILNEYTMELVQKQFYLSFK